MIELDNYFAAPLNFSKVSKLFEKKHFVQNKMLALVCRAGKVFNIFIYKVMGILKVESIEKLLLYEILLLQLAALINRFIFPTQVYLKTFF